MSKELEWPTSKEFRRALYLADPSPDKPPFEYLEYVREKLLKSKANAQNRRPQMSDLKPLAFFRDIDHESNLEDGRTFHASGIVASRHGTKSQSGKDLAVVFWHPFLCRMECEWRADNDVELFPINRWEQDVAAQSYLKETADD